MHLPLRLFILAITIASIDSVLGADQSAILPPGWRLQTVFIPRFLILGPDGIVQNLTQLRHPSGAELPQYDLRAGLAKALGVEFPEGALAIYDERGSTLAVLGPDDLIEYVETIGFGGQAVDYQVRITATLAGFDVLSVI